MNRFSSYNKIFLLYKYPHYIHYNEHGEFIPINLSNVHYNAIDYITVQGLFEYTQPNVRYYVHHIHGSFLNVQKVRHERIYMKLQRFKLAFSRFIHMAKLRYKRKYNTTNLVLQPFQNTPILICDNDCVYAFEDLELYHMVQSCFNYEQFHIPTILKLKNPYTNIPFKLHHLIYIYFELLKRGKNALFFAIYFKHHFSRDVMTKQYEIQLYIHCLERKYNELSQQQKQNMIFRMFRVFTKYKHFKNVNMAILMRLFQSILKPFYIFQNLNKIGVDDETTIMEYYEKKIIHKLDHVYIRNPTFGRKIFSKTLSKHFVSTINENTLYF